MIKMIILLYKRHKFIQESGSISGKESGWITHSFIKLQDTSFNN